MLVAATGYADAFWRSSAWYLSILVDLSLRPGRKKMIKLEKVIIRMEKFIVRMERFIVRMERFIVRMEKFIVRLEKFAVKMEKNIECAWQIWSCYLEAVTRGLSS
jgi:hypothetical protein